LEISQATLHEQPPAAIVAEPRYASSATLKQSRCRNPSVNIRSTGCNPQLIAQTLVSGIVNKSKLGAEK
jgi:hypothetical protein